MSLLRYTCSILLLLALLPGCAHAQFELQPKSITQTYFPDPEVEINTPAFAKKSGFTTYAEMMAWLQTRIQSHPGRLQLGFIGQSQKGVDIPLLRLRFSDDPAPVRIWMQGGLHGDEPAGTEAMLYLVDRLLTDTALARSFRGLELAIIPMANIDGYQQLRRESANGIDLNRDQTRLRAPESVALKRAFNDFAPAVALDFHEYRPFRKDFARFGTEGYASRYDAMFLYSGNLNVPAELRTYTRDVFVKQAKDVLTAEKLVHHDYVTTQKYGRKVEFNLGSVHARSSATSFALANTVSTLLEIRGVGLGRTSFKRRVYTSYQIALSYLRTAAADRAHLTETLAKAAATRQPVVVLSRKKVYPDSLSFIDIGSGKVVSMLSTLHSALESTPTLTRSRPTAYLLLPDQKRAVRVLRGLGLRVDSLAAGRSLDVQTLRPGALQFDTTGAGDDESDNEDTPGTQPGTEQRLLPIGTYIVRMDQPRANLAAEVLEPENPNGFVATRIIRLSPGAELPVYRYLGPENLK